MNATPQRSIILIGYRATGKTSIASRLAETLKIPAFDSDVEIERRAGKSITEIFASEGEPAFRDLEQSVIEEALKLSPLVLATGGGAILRAETRRLLNNSGEVVWLTASPSTILKRISGDETSMARRPGLTNLPMLDEIVLLLEKRSPFYREIAHRIILTENRSIEEIVKEILFLEYGPVV